MSNINIILYYIMKLKRILNVLPVYGYIGNISKLFLCVCGGVCVCVCVYIISYPAFSTASIAQTVIDLGEKNNVTCVCSSM